MAKQENSHSLPPSPADGCRRMMDQYLNVLSMGDWEKGDLNETVQVSVEL